MPVGNSLLPNYTFNQLTQTNGGNTNPYAAFGVKDQLYVQPKAAAPTQAPQAQPSGGGGGGGGGSRLDLWRSLGNTGDLPVGWNGPSQQTADPYAQVRGDISSGWDSYIGSLNDILNNGLNGQRTSQENIANSQYDQGVNSLGLQKTQGLQQLDQSRTDAENNQTKTLKDISGNIKNAFQAGNVYLGARGSGDSSAANQYSYALTKLGSQQRGDVMNNTSNILDQVNARETNLNNVYNSEVNNLSSARDQQINQIASWFSDAQNQLKQQIAQGQLGKGQDLASLSKEILNHALQARDQIMANYQSQTNALQSWAMSNSQNINQLKSNLQGISQYSPQLPGSSSIVGTPSVDSTGNIMVPTGYGGSTQRKDIFGNPIG